MQTINEYLNENCGKIQEKLLEFVRIPSISAQKEYSGDCMRAAEWLKDYFESIRFHAQLFPLSSGHAIVFAESPKIPEAPTLLIYGHYDVQPVDPLNLWTETKPFEPVIRDEIMYGRGASDDKGPLFAHVAAAEFWMKMSDDERPRLNVKFFLEGDEEGGNSCTEIFVRDHADLLACDYLALSDSTQFAPGMPSIACALRGVAAYELTLHGPFQDLHSGMFGGAVTNPCDALVRILSNLHDEEQRVAIPGFYEDVRRLTNEEEEQMARLPFSEKDFYASVGVAGGIGEKDASVLERISSRPTCDINGITGGYQGEGGKTIIPSKASAKISFRLVPNQDPEWLTAALKHWVEAQLPPGITLDFTVESQSGSMMVDITRPCMKAAVKAIEFGFGRPPVFVREGGSIPIVAAFTRFLTPNIMMIALTQKSDNAHGPNENFSMTDFLRGIKTGVKLWQELANL